MTARKNAGMVWVFRVHRKHPGLFGVVMDYRDGYEACRNTRGLQGLQRLLGTMQEH